MKFGLSERTYNAIKKVIENNSKYTFRLFGSRAKGTFKKLESIKMEGVDF